MPPVVFPIGAYRKELAADHLDRLLGKSILDRFIHQGSVAEDGDTGGTNQPQGSRKGRSPDAERHANAQQDGVQLRGVETTESQVQVPAFQLANAVETGADEDDHKQQQRVGQQAVDAEHHKDDGIVAGEVGEVVVHPALDFTKVGRLRQALEVEEFGDRAQVGKAGAERLAADVVEAIAKTRGDGINGDLDGHDGWWKEYNGNQKCRIEKCRAARMQNAKWKSTRCQITREKGKGRYFFFGLAPFVHGGFRLLPPEN